MGHLHGDPGSLKGFRVRDLGFYKGIKNVTYLGIQKPTVLGVRPSSSGVITYYFVGFGATGCSRLGEIYRLGVLFPRILDK